MRYFFAFLLTAVLSAAVIADEAPRSNSGRSGRRGGMSGRRGGNFMEQIKKQYPKEFAEIEKLRESDPEKAQSKMREIMSKMRSQGFGGRGRFGRGGMAVEPTEEQLAVIKAKFPAEFAEYEKLKADDPGKARHMLAELMKKTFGEDVFANPKNLRDRNRRAVSRVMAELKRQHPEKFAEIEKMQAVDPDGARRELRKLFAQSEIRIPTGARELNYEYVDPKLQQQQQRGGMGGFNPFGGRMGGFGRWGGRR